jgi:CRP/FNR family cyclic AMP-dependent transcriptional regulator
LTPHPVPSPLELVASHPELALTSFEQGSILLAEGPATDKMYVLASGQIEVLKGKVPVAWISDPGAIFGEISALLKVGHSATVRAATPLTAFEIVGAEKFLRDSPDMMANVARLLARRLVDATTYLTDLKQQYADRDDHLGMVDEVLEALVQQQEPQVSAGSSRRGDSRLDDGAA